MPDEVKLEPCPRCGNRAFITGTDSYQVWCLTGKCLLLPARASRDDAIADWNRRPIEAPPCPELVELVAQAVGQRLTVSVYEDDGQGRYVSQRFEAEIDIEDIESAAIAPIEATRPTAATDDVVAELRHRLRMIISHASGGALSDPADIDRSVNDICVEISRHKNDIWKHAQEAALAKKTAQQGDVVKELVEALELAVPIIEEERQSTVDCHTVLYRGSPDVGKVVDPEAVECIAIYDAALSAARTALARTGVALNG